MDSFLKNVGSSAESIRMECNEPFFRDCFDNVVKVGDTPMIKSVETRFPSQHSMTERVKNQKKVFKTLVKDELFVAWFSKETKVIRLEVHALVCTTVAL
jgi:hypothetical protein